MKHLEFSQIPRILNQVLEFRYFEMFFKKRDYLKALGEKGYDIICVVGFTANP